MSASWEIRQGDVLDRLREMPDESVQCCITSPPYFVNPEYVALAERRLKGVTAPLFSEGA